MIEQETCQLLAGYYAGLWKGFAFTMLGMVFIVFTMPIARAAGKRIANKILINKCQSHKHNYKPYYLRECIKGSLSHSWKHGDQSLNAKCQKCRTTRRELTVKKETK